MFLEATNFGEARNTRITESNSHDSNGQQSSLVQKQVSADETGENSNKNGRYFQVFRNECRAVNIGYGFSDRVAYSRGKSDSHEKPNSIDEATALGVGAGESFES